MSYGYGFSALMHVLGDVNSAQALMLEESRRETEFGLLSVGLKIHVTHQDVAKSFQPLISRLGGFNKLARQNIYRGSDALLCLVLHPMGGPSSAILLLELLERFTGCGILGNPHIQVQVCSPGRLDMRRAALLGTVFYLASDTLRRYKLQDFETTVSNDNNYKRGKRLLIYDAQGDFDPDFEWPVAEEVRQERIGWFGNKKSKREIKRLPFDRDRTDILAGTASSQDIRNINLIGTLLCHAQYPEHEGLWHEVGRAFEMELYELLDQHMLLGLLEAPWVSLEKAGAPESDAIFISVLQELVAYALAEAERIRHDSTQSRSGILYAINDIVNRYRHYIEQQYVLLKGDGR